MASYAMPLFLNATFIALMVTALAAGAQQRWLMLPTENHAIFEGAPENFYMHVDRVFEERAFKAYSGGRFGMVRTPIRHNGEVIHIHFHEGADIAPVRRDRHGEPLDPVMAPTAGRVVHVSTVAGNSNYGKYVVLEHILAGAPYYTLYAHLADASVTIGDELAQGSVLGRIGHSGKGLNRDRAHLHYEFCLLYNDAFHGWYQKHYPGQPYLHGIYNGLNLFGLDPIGLTRAVLAVPDLSVPDYIRGQTPLFKLTVATRPQIAERYPWLAAYLSPSPIANAWSITFSNQFVPQQVSPAIATNHLPAVQWLGRTDIPLKWQSRGLLSGGAANPKLTPAGLRLADLLTYDRQ